MAKDKVKKIHVGRWYWVSRTYDDEVVKMKVLARAGEELVVHSGWFFDGAIHITAGRIIAPVDQSDASVLEFSGI